MNKIYFDYAASTPVDPRVEAEMRPYFTMKFGNPGSLHSFGQEAIAAVDNSREIIAKAIGADFREIIFTGSATEANNLALRGIIKGFRQFLRRTAVRSLQSAFGGLPLSARGGSESFYSETAESFIPRIIASSIEHESVLETARDLEHEGVEVIYLPVNRKGIIDLKKLKSALNERTILVSVMYANNEIGTIQPIAEISKIVRDFRDELRIKNNESRKNSSPIIHNSSFIIPLLHTDAAQAFQFLDCGVDKLGADLMTISGHKIYGPKGIGALFMEHGTWNMKQKSTIQDSNFKIQGIITGGGQEFGLRSGTENVSSIVGFAKAVEIALSIKHRESRRITEIRDYFWRGLKKIYPKAEVNGMMNDELRIKKSRSNSIIHNSKFTLPNILNIYFPDYSAQDLLAKFDLAGIAVSGGSACRTRAVSPSYTIEALGYSEERAENSIRFSFGRPTAKKEIDKALKIIRKLLK